MHSGLGSHGMGRGVYAYLLDIHVFICSNSAPNHAREQLNLEHTNT